MRKITYISLSVIILAFAFLATIPYVAHAATLHFSPSSGTHTRTTFSVNVLVSSADQAMNAASGIISFPKDKLEVVSLSKIGSIFGLWVQEPYFSNTSGIISFEGIVLNPGFIGSNGKALTITFRTKTAGPASLTFSSGSVLANDGKGTNILSGLDPAAFFLDEVAPNIAAAGISGTPPAPIVFSPTHPDPTAWYAKSDPSFAWELPKGITGVRLLVDTLLQTIPTVTYIPPISSKELTAVEDGTWYLHIQFQNNKGWGEISHFRFRIDTQPPEQFAIEFIDGTETKNPKPTVIFDTTDSLSGINYYKVKIGEGDFVSVTTELVRSNPYALPLQKPGRRTILVQAFDNAGNYSVATERFSIEPLHTPVFTAYPRELRADEMLTVTGETQYPGSQIIIWLQREKGIPQKSVVTSDQDGKFIFTTDKKLADGTYKLWAEVVDARGAQSLPTDTLTITIVQPMLARIGFFLAVTVPLTALALLLAFVTRHGRHTFTVLKKKLKKETSKAEHAVHKTLSLLQADAESHATLLKKAQHERQLTTEEKKVLRQLKKALDDADKLASKNPET